MSKRRKKHQKVNTVATNDKMSSEPLKTSGTSETLEASKASEMPGSLEASKTSGMSDSLEASKDSETPESLESSEASKSGKARQKDKKHFNLADEVHFLKAKMRMEGGKAFLIYRILRVLVIITAIRCLVTGNYENFALCLFSLVLFLLPSFFEEKLKVEIPPLFEAIIYIFIFSAEILGEVNKYYTNIPGWDTLLHTLNGFLCAAIGFSLVEILNRRGKKVRLSPIYLSVVAFCFSMTVGVCWEFIEFTCDQLFYLDMQKDFIVTTIGSVTLDPTHSQTPLVIRNITKTIIETADGQTYTIDGGYLDIGIIDTMKDLLVNLIGAITFSVIGYFYEANRTKKEKDNSTFAQTSAKVVDGLKLRTLTDEQLEEEHEQIYRQEKAIAQERAEREQERREKARQNLPAAKPSR